MSFWKALPEPQTGLGRYRTLATRAGVRVSPIQLGACFRILYLRDLVAYRYVNSGAMSIGDQWDKLGMGSMDKELSFKLLDAYFDAGGNFIDTANN
jgi:hypothetical protein